MEKTIQNFKDYWDGPDGFRHIEMVLSDSEIQDFLDRYPSVELACNAAVDYVLSQGLGEVQE